MSKARLHVHSPIVELRQVCAGYAGRVAVHGVSLALLPGERNCLIGRNGSGKSTILKAIVGQADVIRGDLMIDGESRDSVRLHNLIHRGIIYVPQDRGDFPSLTTMENLRVAALAVNSLTPDALLERAFNTMPDLRPLRNRRVGTLSGGERTLVALGRALVAQPCLRLLLVDEPSAGVSETNRTLVAEVLHVMTSTGAAVLIVEQDRNFAASLGFATIDMESLVGQCDECPSCTLMANDRKESVTGGPTSGAR